MLKLIVFMPHLKCYLETERIISLDEFSELQLTNVEMIIPPQIFEVEHPSSFLLWEIWNDSSKDFYISKRRRWVLRAHILKYSGLIVRDLIPLSIYILNDQWRSILNTEIIYIWNYFHSWIFEKCRIIFIKKSDLKLL